MTSGRTLEFYVQTFTRVVDQIVADGRVECRSAREAEEIAALLATSDRAPDGAVAVVMTRDAQGTLTAVQFLTQHGVVPEGYGAAG